MKSISNLLYNKNYWLILLIFSLVGCETREIQEESSLFQKVQPTSSGVDFLNFIVEDQHHNIFFFDYMYNGAGVSIGDINNDGLPDIYFTGNLADNKLYLNKGNFVFEDITNSAGVAAPATWCNGSNFVDVNGDGYLDIYVCRSYYNNIPENRRNLLFINNKDNTFSNRAKEYGVDDIGHSMQSVFFDADLDGDLDLYLANHPESFAIRGEERYDHWLNPRPENSNKFYINNGNNTFSDQTESAGLLDFSYSLGVVAGDFNKDGWSDLFISNDYSEPDRYYINQGDGTFVDQLPTDFKHISNFGMGVDAADFNNDGSLDLVTVDMLAESNYREKTQMGSMEPAAFWVAVDWGLHYQYMRNCLHLNNGNGSFSEIGQLAGVHRTDWSWGPLLADFDLDGYKDLFVTNGFRRDSRNKDTRLRNDRILAERQGDMQPGEIIDLLKSIPSTKVSNYLFKNQGDYTFKNITQSAGVNDLTFSNGNAYADLDLDGDLDLVVNNLLDTALLYRNMSIENKSGNYLKVKLKGNQLNKMGLGCKLTISYDGVQQFIEHTNVRGYLSSMNDGVHFGLGTTPKIDELKVEWQDGRVQILENLKVNQTITIDQAAAQKVEKSKKIVQHLFQQVELNEPFIHKENYFDDYSKQVLLPHKMSQFGPALAVGDVNNDGLDDFYVGGAKNQTAALYFQKEDGMFELDKTSLWEGESNYEDVGALFFDADNDKDLDLYVASGGNSDPANSDQYQDRLYINDGNGRFERARDRLPDMTSSNACIVAADFDQDGDLDLFVGARHLPWSYPETPTSYLLENENGTFKDITNEVSGLAKAGMVTDAIWIDFEKDDYPELVLVGEWMPIKIFDNQMGELKEVTEEKGLGDAQGWWFSIAAGDFDQDGDMDLIAGNLGENYKYQASLEQPFHLYSNDFDSNGSNDIVLAGFNIDGVYPVRGRQCSSEQLPVLKEKFPNYESFGKSTLKDIYGESLDQSNHFMVNTFSSMYVKNNGDQGFELIPLPKEAQFFPVNGIVVKDIDKDGHLDAVLAGNLHVSEVETGRADAGTGLLLKGNGNGTFETLSSQSTGLWATRDVKGIEILNKANSDNYLLIGNNNSQLELFLVNGVASKPLK